MKKIHKIALFGHPVKHSLSPQIHHFFAKQFTLEIDYQLHDVQAQDFPLAVNDFFSSGGWGANVTLPYKSLALQCVKKISPLAQAAQVANTFYYDQQQNLCASTTDGIGFLHDLNKRCQFNCKHKNILILGAGGAAAGIVPAIMQQQPASLVLANRSLEKAKKILHYKNTQALSLAELEKYPHAFDLIIHASSLGHLGQTLKFSTAHSHANTLCYDLSYGQAAQPFLAFCSNTGIKYCFDGIGMLVEQAACAFELWFNKKPSTHEILAPNSRLLVL